MRKGITLGCVLALSTLSCSGSGTDASSASGCVQQSNGGLSVQQCTCAAVIASLPSSSRSTVVLVDSTTADQISPYYDLGLPAGTPVCFVGMKGEFTVTGPSPPPAADDASSSASVTFPYSIVIYTESPWRVVESGEQLQQPTPDAG
jgi:hypothetical protein